MSDFDQFLTAMRWKPKPGAVQPGEPRSWDKGPIDQLPELSALLETATVTPVLMNGQEFQLLAFGPEHARRGWLTLPPVAAEATTDVAMPAAHKELVTRFGGIGDVFGVSDGWWSANHRDILTASAMATDFGELLDAYSWAWEDDGLEVPINAEDYYVAAIEANGNQTLVHRVDGSVILFAPDHAYANVSVLDGCPPYSLYTIDGALDLTSWIETNAAFWRSL